MEEVERNIAQVLHELIYDYVWSAKDYVAQLPKLPYITDAITERDYNMVLYHSGSRRLRFLPLHNRCVSYRSNSIAFWMLTYVPPHKLMWTDDRMTNGPEFLKKSPILKLRMS